MGIYKYFSTCRYTTKLYVLSDFVSITWLGDFQKAAIRRLWDSRVARAKNDAPEHGKAEVLYMAMKETLHVELMLFDQHQTGHIKPKNASEEVPCIVTYP